MGQELVPELVLIMNKTKAQIFEGVLSIVVNALLFGVKFWVGMLTGSIALVADAWHTLSDSLTSIFVAFSVKLQTKEADKEHPFGHGRWEQISSIFVAVVLAVIGYDFLRNSINRFKNRESVFYGTIAIVITIISIIIKELMAQIAFYIGRKTNNTIVKADGWHHRSDSLSSVVVLIGILVTKTTEGLWWMDSVLGIFCSLAIFYAAFEIMKESIKKILGEMPSKELINQLENSIKILYKDDLSIHHVHIHNYITQQELTFHIRLNNNLTIKEGHIVATNIEKMILEELNMIATIHVEPIERIPKDK